MILTQYKEFLFLYSFFLAIILMTSGRSNDLTNKRSFCVDPQ